MPNPENRVLFELTTISNEIGRDNMTTVQTTLIPHSGRSQKQNPYGKHVRRGSSEQAKYFTTHDPVAASMPFNVEPDLQNYREQLAQPVNSAYREVVMNQARRHHGIESQHPKTQNSRN